MNQFHRKERWRNPSNMERTSPLSNEAFRLAKIGVASSLVFGRRGACSWPEGLFDDFSQPIVHGPSATGNPAKQQHECAPSISARLFQAQDEERRRISRELHDSVGQSLTVILMNLEVLSRTVVDKTLEETIDLVKDVSREVRTISYLMHPPMLDLCGLETAINCYSEGFSKRCGIKTEVKVLVELPRLQTEKETALYRVVQECLTNVHRHSGASKARIRIEVNEGQLRLEVEDNGKGFASKDVDASPPHAGQSGRRDSGNARTHARTQRFASYTVQQTRYQGDCRSFLDRNEGSRPTPGKHLWQAPGNCCARGQMSNETAPDHSLRVTNCAPQFSPGHRRALR